MPTTRADIEWLLAQDDWVKRLARRLLGDGPDADDLVQETWLRALFGARRERRSRAWLATVARNVARERFRADARRSAREEAAARPESDQARAVEEVELRRDLLDLVLALPAAERSALVLHTIDGLQYDEVARRLGVSETAARKRASRALDRLRARIDASPRGRDAWVGALLLHTRAHDVALPLDALGAAPSPLPSASFHVSPQALTVGAVLLMAGGVFSFWRAPAEGVKRTTTLELAGASGPARAPAAAELPRPATVLERLALGEAEPLAAGRLVVRVVAEETGAPIVDALVDAPYTYLSNTYLFTDVDGRVTFSDFDGERVELLFEEPAHGDSARVWADPIPPGEVRHMEVALRTVPDLSVFGQVRDALTGVPVEGARVRVRVRPREALGELIDEIATDGSTGPDGRFAIEACTWETPRGRVDAPGYGPVSFTLRPGHDSRERALVIDLRRGAALHGVITGLKGSGHYVWAAGDLASSSDWGQLSRHGPTRTVWRAPVGADGSWRIADLPPDVSLALALNRGQERVDVLPRPLRLADGEDREIEWRLDARATIAGRVTLAGNGAALTGHPVWLLAPNGLRPPYRITKSMRPAAAAVTDEDGRFELQGVSPGAWSIGPAPLRSEFDVAATDEVAPDSEPLVVPPGGGVLQVSLVVHHGLYIRGTVLAPDGALAAGHGSVVADHADSRIRVAARAEEGAFSVGPLPPGQFSLFATREECTTSERVDARAGDEGVVLSLRPAGSIRGRLLDAVTGRAIPGDVRLSPCDRALGYGGSGGVASEEGYSLEGLLAGTYQFVARTGNLVSDVRVLTVGPGEALEGIDLVLREGATLVASYRGARKRATLQVFRDGNYELVLGLSPGSERRVALTGGRYTLRTEVDMGLEEPRVLERTVDLVEGETTGVEFGDDE